MVVPVVPVVPAVLAVLAVPVVRAGQLCPASPSRSIFRARPSECSRPVARWCRAVQKDKVVPVVPEGMAVLVVRVARSIRKDQPAAAGRLVLSGRPEPRTPQLVWLAPSLSSRPERSRLWVPSCNRKVRKGPGGKSSRHLSHPLTCSSEQHF